MHNRERADYPDSVFDEVVAWLRAAVEDALAAGVARERLIVDPGIGFGKTPDDSIELLHRLGELKSALGGLPMLVGTSRKRFVGELLGGAPPEDRLEGTAATVALAIAQGADMVRVHDVEPMTRTVRVADGIVRWRR
jgi:dihydropteroate synthase